MHFCLKNKHLELSFEQMAHASKAVDVSFEHNQRAFYEKTSSIDCPSLYWLFVRTN